MKKHDRKNANRSQSGQAVTELTVMLVALVAVILGVVFVSGLAVTNNKILLEAKRNAEYAARLTEAEPQLTALEHSGWSYGSFAYSGNQTVSIPFSALDRPVRTESNSLQNAALELRTAEYSESPRYQYAWKAPRDFNAQEFSADASATLGNALDAAALTAGKSSETEPVAGFDKGYRDRAAADMRNAFFHWFGIKIDKNDLRKNLTNTVYMPTGKPVR